MGVRSEKMSPGESLRRTYALFNRYAFSEVSRLIDIAASLQRDIIREQLQAHHAERRQEHELRIGDSEERIDALFHLRLAAFGRKREDACASGLDLDDVAHRLFKKWPIEPQRNDERAVFDERDRAVLELAGCVGLGVDIGNLLELQRAFQAEGIVEVPADEEHRIVIEILRGEELDLLAVCQNRLDLLREHLELFDQTGEQLCSIGHEFGAVTGRRRRCGWLDLVALKYSIMINGVTQLIMMKSDVMNDFDTVKVAVAYEIGGERTTRFPFETEADIKPVYREFPGWKSDLRKVTRYEEFPEAFRNYVEFIEQQTGDYLDWPRPRRDHRPLASATTPRGGRFVKRRPPHGDRPQ